MKSLLVIKPVLSGVTALILCAASSCWMEVWAQRTMRGEYFLSAQALSGTVPPSVTGAEVSFGQYLLSSYWKAGVTASSFSGYTLSRPEAGYAHLAAYGDWMERIAATRNRMLNIYAGGGVFLGYEAYTPQTAPVVSETGEQKEGAFLYGVHAGLEAEFFVMKRLALVISGKVPVNFTSPHGWLHGSAGAGLRYNF